LDSSGHHLAFYDQLLALFALCACHAAAAAGDGFVDRGEFEALYKQLFPKASQEGIDRAFASLDLEGNGKVDIISW
jgi:hypothetical protein